MWRTALSRRARLASVASWWPSWAPRCAARLQPRLGERVVDDLEQRPDEVLDEPRVRVGLDFRRRRHRVRDEPPRRRELDVRADAVHAICARAEARRQALGQPALHPARRDGDDLGGERVGRRLAQEHAQRIDEAVGPLGSMDVQHPRGSRSQIAVDRRSPSIAPPRDDGARAQARRARTW